MVSCRYPARKRQVLDASEDQQRDRQGTQAPAMGLSFKSDVYSFAIIAWEVLALKVLIDSKISYL